MRQPISDVVEVPVPEASGKPGEAWSKALASLMADFQVMDGIRRKAFLKGLDFATASIQLAAINVEARGSRNAAAAFRHLAATIGGAALAMGDMGKNRGRNRER